MNGNIRIFIAGDFCSKPSTQHIKVDKDLVDIIQGTDISIVNFEVPLKPSINLPKDGYERFYQNDDAPDFLRSIGFKLFSTANNHMFDWEEHGYHRVRETFGDSMFGSGTYDEALSIKVVDIKGKKIGFLALSYGARKGVFNDVHNRKELGCAYLYDLKVNHIIVSAKEKVDYLFILPHAGVEYCDIPTPELMAKYRDFVDWGADCIIASHPHCPQGWEEYNGKKIFYSLGNFFFNSKPSVDFVARRPHWYEGISVMAEITSEGIKTEVINTRNIKNRRIVIDKDPSRELHNKYLCNLLQDVESYDKYLNMMDNDKVKYITKILSSGLNFGSLKHLIKSNISFLIDIIYRRKDSKLQSVKSLVNDEMQMAILRRVINNKSTDKL
ncbi:MAG: CapA family protein [Alistipes sp.]|nr:CapA family protein [Alistipes sp.]